MRGLLLRAVEWCLRINGREIHVEKIHEFSLQSKHKKRQTINLPFFNM